MAKLYSIEIVERMGLIEIQAHWNNHRHQAVKLKSLEPFDVMQGIVELHRVLDGECHEGEI